MPASSRSTTPTVTDHAEEVDPETALQQRLGLRPVYVPAGTQTPDHSPCPSWCEMVTDPRPNGIGHGFDPGAPSYSTHTLYPSPTVRASLYAAHEHAGPAGPPAITTAYVEVDLVQNGSAAPMVTLTLMRPGATGAARREERLRLTVVDADELRSALGYVVEAAEAGFDAAGAGL